MVEAQLTTSVVVEAVAFFGGALALFLFGIGELSRSLQALAGDRLRRFLHRVASTPLRALGAGVLATVLAGSSSATTIFTVALVDSGLLALTPSLAVVLGANVGTTASSQFIAWGATELAPLGLLLGLALRHFGRSARTRDRGAVVFAMGLVLFALELMEHAVSPVAHHPGFLAAMASLRHPLWGVAVGAGITLVIQSSSATVGTAVALAAQGVLPLEAGLAVMMGAEIGTTSDTFLASLGRSRAALRTGLFQVLFNVASLVPGLLALPLLAAAVRAVFASPGPQLALAHFLFNVVGALVALPFVPRFARWLTLALPDMPPRSGEASAPG